MKYAQILQLLEAWGSFEEASKQQDLESFARYILKNRTANKPSPRLAKNYAGVPIEVQLNVLLHRLNRSWEIQSKEVFIESGSISSLSELRILSCIANKNQPKKKEVINEILLETTTGTMLIQRLVGRGLLTETPDVEDRRAQRLDLTEEGKTALGALSGQLLPMIAVFFAPLNEVEKSQMIEYLMRLDGDKNI